MFESLRISRVKCLLQKCLSLNLDITSYSTVTNPITSYSTVTNLTQSQVKVQ